MYLYLIIITLIIYFLSGVFGFIFKKKSGYGQLISIVLLCIGGAIGIFSSFAGFFRAPYMIYATYWKSAGRITLGIDSLSAFFLVLIFSIGTLGAIYGIGYWKQQEHPDNARGLQLFWGWLVSGMGLLVISRHALPFILGWELMAISAFFLISTEDGKEDCRKSALIYLIATHVCTLLIFLMFVFWHHVTGSFLFTPVLNGQISHLQNNILFFLIFISFGIKAGIFPLHFWLPGAHANAPSHVSAILSGVMLKMGIYGIIRMTLLLPHPPAVWGVTILVSGSVSGLLGVIFAIAQHDIKRLLAYHSVENIGIILMGFGIALLGLTYDKPVWFALGMAGCLLHVWNHGIFKSLLFFGAGSVIHASGTGIIDNLGGLAKKMPWTSVLFFTGAIAICGLPPLNGFISEFFIYSGFLQIAADNTSHIAGVAAGAVILAVIGALAVACFVKVYSVVFLGNRRSNISESVHESSMFMMVPMFILGMLCLVIGVFPVLISPILQSVIRTPLLTEIVPFKIIEYMNILFISAAAVTAAVLYFILKGKTRKTITWDCGYASPGNSMQYTASSFAGGIVKTFDRVLHTHGDKPEIKLIFPQEKIHFKTHVSELILDRFVIPCFRKITFKFSYFNRFQQGKIQYYVLYIVIAVLILLLTLLPYRKMIEKIFTTVSY